MPSKVSRSAPATQLAKRRLGLEGTGDKLPGWPPEARPLPVRVILRRFAGWLPEDATASAGLVWDYLRHQLEQRDGCLGAFDGLHEMLTREGGIVFFDGLDQVHEDDARRHRSLIRDSIAEFLRPLESCRVVVTCREYAYRYDDAWRLPEADFPAVTLAPFGDEQVRAFTATWYRVLGPAKTWSADRCEREAEQLASAVIGWPLAAGAAGGDDEELPAADRRDRAGVEDEIRNEHRTSGTPGGTPRGTPRRTPRRTAGGCSRPVRGEVRAAGRPNPPPGREGQPRADSSLGEENPHCLVSGRDLRDLSNRSRQSGSETHRLYPPTAYHP